MPTYATLCKSCGAQKDVYRTLANYEDMPDCCGAQVQRLITAPGVIAEIPSYQSPIDGRWIDSRAQRNEDLKRNGCRPWEGLAAERKEAGRKASEDRQQMDRKLDETVNRSWAQLSERSKRALSDY